jgi:hypothetical protein
MRHPTASGVEHAVAGAGAFRFGPCAIAWLGIAAEAERSMRCADIVEQVLVVGGEVDELREGARRENA